MNVLGQQYHHQDVQDSLAKGRTRNVSRNHLVFEEHHTAKTGCVSLARYRCQMRTRTLQTQGWSVLKQDCHVYSKIIFGIRSGINTSVCRYRDKEAKSFCTDGM